MLTQVHRCTRLEILNSRKLKRITFILTLLFSFGLLAEESPITEADIESFERECLKEEAIQDESCLERYAALEQYINDNNHLATTSEEGVACMAREVASPEEVEDLATELDDVSANLACTEEDAEYVQDSCGKQMACNMGRSIVTIVDQVAPDFITNRVQRSIGSLLSAEESSSCMDKDQPDCLSEIYRAFISSLVGTFNSLRDIGRAIGGAFSNMRAYLFEKSDDLHTAADTTQEEATRFMDSPGQYIVEKLTGFKNGIDNWIKTQVFCQKWEGEPHSEDSTCVEPLAAYSCLDCDDGINAFCAGAGFFISEGLLTVATAGTVTGLGIAARVGVAATKAATVRGASVLAARVPALARLTTRTTRTTRRTARPRNRVFAAALAKYNRAKESVSRFGAYIANSRVGRAADAVADVAMAPLRLVDNLSNRAMETVLAGATKVKGTNSVSRLIRQTAREDFRIIRRANRGEELASSGATRATRSLAGARTIRLTNRRRVSSDRGRGRESDRGPSREEPRTGPESEPRRETPEETRRREETQREQTRREEERRREETRREEERRREEARREEERRREEEERRRQEEEEERRRTETDGAPTPRLAGGDDALRSGRRIPLDSTNGVTRATRLGIAADLAIKAGRAVEDVPVEAISEEAARAAIEGEEQAALNNNESFREQINARTGASFEDEQQARRFADNMRQIYSDPSQKSKIIERLMSRRGYDREQADRIYNSERNFYNNRTGSGFFGPRGKYADEQEEINDLVERIATIRKNIEDQENEEDTPVATATPGAEPTPEELREQEALKSRGPLTRAGTRRVATVNGGFAPAPISGGSEAPLATGHGDQEYVPSEEAVGETETPPKEETAPTAKAEGPSEEPVDPEARENSAQRLATMEFLSLLLVEMEGGSLEFRTLSARERSMITSAQEGLASPMELSHIQVATVNGPVGPYFVFKDFKNNRTVVLTEQGQTLSGVPEDII